MVMPLAIVVVSSDMEVPLCHVPTGAYFPLILGKICGDN